MEYFEYEDYRHPWETGNHWKLKREFMRRYKDTYPLDRLLCLAQAYSNIELFNCSYPAEVMKEVYELSKPLKAAAPHSNDASTPAKGQKTKASDQDSGRKFKFIKFCSSSDAQDHTDTTSGNKQTAKQDLEVVDPCIKPAQDVSTAQNEVDMPLMVEDNQTKIISENMKKITQEIRNQNVLNNPNVEAIHNASSKTSVKVTIDMGRNDSCIKPAQDVSTVQNEVDMPLMREDNQTKIISENMKKIAQEIRNQKVLNRPNVEAIHNASSKTSVKVTFDLGRKLTTFTCKLYIDDTLISIAEGTTKKNAKLKACDQTVAILLDSSNSYSELLNIIKQSKQLDSPSNTCAPQMSSTSHCELSCKTFDMEQNNQGISPVEAKPVAATEENTLYELDVNQIKLHLVQEFGNAFMQNFVTEIECALEKHDVYFAIIFAARVLKIHDVIDFKYDAQSSINENMTCKLFIKNIVVGIGKGSSKKNAMQEAAANAFRYLLNSKLWADGEHECNILPKHTLDSDDKNSGYFKGPIRNKVFDQKKYILLSSNDPNENPLQSLERLSADSNTCSITNEDVKNIWSLIKNLETYVQFEPPQAFSCAAEKAKISQHISYKVTFNEQTVVKTKMYLCELFFKNILISSGTGRSKVKSRQNAGNAAAEKLLHLKNFIIKEYDPSTSSLTSANKNSNTFEITSKFELNENLLRSTIQKQFILLDNSEMAGGNNISAGAILNRSAAFSHKCITYEHSEHPLNDGSLTSAQRFDVMLDKTIVGTGISYVKSEAKRLAASNALENLKKVVYMIKAKDIHSDNIVIQRNQLINSQFGSGALTESNVGCKMLKMMGWTGGGIGKTSGIVEPIMADKAHSHCQGLGFTQAGSKIVDFRRKIHDLLEDFKISNSFNDLVFASDFSKEERKEVHGIASRLHLNSTSYGLEGARQLFIKNKFTAFQVLDHLIQAGGSTSKYDLLDLSKE